MAGAAVWKMRRRWSVKVSKGPAGLIFLQNQKNRLRSVPRVAWFTEVEYEETAGTAWATATGALNEKMVSNRLWSANEVQSSPLETLRRLFSRHK